MVKTFFVPFSLLLSSTFQSYVFICVTVKSDNSTESTWFWFKCKFDEMKTSNCKNRNGKSVIETIYEQNGLKHNKKNDRKNQNLKQR